MKIIEITDLNLPELDIYTKISERQLMTINEPAPGLFIAESFKVLERALLAGYKPVSAVVEKSCLEEFEKLSHVEKSHGTFSATDIGPDSPTQQESCFSKGSHMNSPFGDSFPVFTATGDVLDSITGYHLTGGCLCAMERKEIPSPVSILESSRRIVLLENVMNPTNIGAIFRSAAALGMDGVLLTKSCSDPLYRRAIRVSMGTVFQIPWTFIDYWNTPVSDSALHDAHAHESSYDHPYEHPGSKSLAWSTLSWPSDGIDLLHSHGYKLASMALRNESISISDLRLKSEERLCVLMGSEGEGLLSETIEKSDYVVKIPMSHDVDSLNVAAASALAFWELH